ncbi:MAG: hypothetical protein E7299_02980 [Lachnospiraceae bacterium]|nr:hypothetical protein [Lachnospiraceae bacterium]
MKKTYEEFCSYVEENILSLMSDDVKRSAHVEDICKNNGVKLKGLIVTTDTSNISFTLYLEYFYEEYAIGHASLDEVLAEIANTYSDKEIQGYASFDINSLQEANIIGCLVGTNNNMEYLRDIPYVPCGSDFAIIFKYYFERTNNGMIATITITDSLSERLGYDIDKLKQLAMENTPRLLPLKFESVPNLLSGLEGFSDELYEQANIPMYVISNERNSYGAIALLYPGVREMLFDMFESDLVLIPSSIHEWLVIPQLEGIELKEIDEMIYSVNQTQLIAEEVLGERAYVLKRGTSDIFESLAIDYAYSE